MRGIKGSLEAHHDITIQDGALVAAVKLSGRYITDRFLPDKAIDLIDEAAAGLKMQRESEPAELDKAKREISRLNVEREALRLKKLEKNDVRLRELEKKLAGLEEQLQIDSVFKNFNLFVAAPKTGDISDMQFYYDKCLPGNSTLLNNYDAEIGRAHV